MNALKATPFDSDEMDAWFNGDIPRKLLAVPFSGPLKGGLDMDGDRFTKRTDIKADWFPERPALWHHGVDPTGKMGATVIGKAVNPTLEDDGWWVDFWFKAGESRVQTIRKLNDRGAVLYGSTSAIPHLVKKANDGEILVWPYYEQTLSTSPQNTHSVLRPIKAVLDDFDLADIELQPAVKALLELADELRDLPATFASGELAAKAGRELSGSNLSALREWVAVLRDVTSRAEALAESQRKYEKDQE